MAWIFYQSLSCGPTACTVSTGWSFCRHHYSNSRQHRSTCQIAGGHPGHHQRPGTWPSSCWHGALTFNARFPRLYLGHTLLLGVRDEHQVISLEELPWYAGVELTWQSLKHQNEEQWAKDRTLMHTDSHTKLLTVLTIDPHMTPGLGVHALDDLHSPFHDPRAPWGPP